MDKNYTENPGAVTKMQKFMIKSVSKCMLTLIPVMVAILGIFAYKQALAQQISEYRCQTDKIVYIMGTHTVVCSIQAPMDEEKLRFFSEQIYNEVKKPDYFDFSIIWLLIQGAEGEKIITATGLTYFEDGRLVDIDIPQVKVTEQ